MKRFLWGVALAAVSMLSAVASAQEGPERVTMGLDEFLRLYDASKQDTPAVLPKPPREASVSSLAMDGEVRLDALGEPTTALFRAKMEVVVHAHEGSARVPVLLSDAALISVTLGGKVAPVVLEGGAYQLVLPSGRHVLSMAFAVPVVPEAGRTTLRFRLPQAGAVTANVRVPGADLEIATHGAQVTERIADKDGQRLTLALSAGQGLHLSWTRAVASQDDAVAARVDASVSTLVQVGEGLVRAHAVVDHVIRFQGVSALRFAVPEGFAVLDVKAAGMSRWQVEGGELAVDLNWEALGPVRVDVDLERVLDGGGEVQAPMLRPLGVARTKGYLGVTADGTLEVAGAKVTGASVVDVRALPAGLLTLTHQPVLLGYKYLDDEAALTLSVTQHHDVAVLVTLLDQATATTMFTVDGRRITSVAWAVRNNRRQFLRVKMPEGAEIWSAAVGGRAVQPAASTDGHVLVPLLRSADAGGAVSAFGVELVYVESMDGPDSAGAGTFTASLPQVDAPTTYVAWTVFAPDQAKVDLRHVTGNVRHVASLSQPLGPMEALVVTAQQPAANRAATAMVSSGGLGEGTEPVRVKLPLEGRPYHFEKLLALDETLTVGFGYRGLR